jgi:hypothetical protein
MRELRLVTRTAFLVLALCYCICAYSQTAPVVWSCLTNCSATSNTYNDGAFRALTPKPAYVAATTGTNTNCQLNHWNTSGAVRWRATATLAGNACVSIRIGNVESFASASSLWPAEPPPPPVPPAPRVVPFSVQPSIVYTGQPVTVTWGSTDAVTCSSSWAPSVPISGTQSLTIVVPMPDVWVSVTCVNPQGNYTASAGFRVLSKTPDCYPNQDRPGDSDKVAVQAISTVNMTLRYQVMATWFCASPEGPVQQKWALGIQDGVAQMRKWLAKQFNEADVRASCESSCEVLPAGALKDELDAWAAQFTVEQLGVIE